MSRVPDKLRNTLLATATVIAGAVGGAATVYVGNSPTTVSPEVLLAMDIGEYYEGYREYPYKDTGGVWTVCRGITGKAVVPGKRYTPEECKALELPVYLEAEKSAKRVFSEWGAYNMWVRASFLDMLFNLGAGQVQNSTMVQIANTGNLTGACMQQPRWVVGFNSKTGKKERLAGLVNRRNATSEICLEWGATGNVN